MIRIGIDIGGTFTDFAVWRGNEGSTEPILHHKETSTPPRFADAIVAGLEHLLPLLTIAPGEPVLIVHGMTVGTNAVIERSGPPLALLVTEGFRDILRIGRLRLPKPLNLFAERPAPLIPRERTFEVHERLRVGGTVVDELDTGSVIAAAKSAHSHGVSTVAVCFLHSHSNAAHEEAAREAILDAVPGLDVVLSSEVWPQEGEYERATLAVLNAYVKTVMSAYLGELETYLARRLPSARLFVATSNGGMMAAGEARRFPVHTLLSGPAAGITASRFVGTLLQRNNLLTMDMGGTSTDMSLVVDGRAITSSQAEVGDFPLTMPLTTIEAMGAGGGSIVWLDGSVLRVGPRSAGASPGPACYDRGGEFPTLSDAYLLCGYLGESLLGGKLKLNRAKAEAALMTVASKIGIDAFELAEHCVTVATANMLAKALPFLARMGVDPEQLTLLPFGGAGAIHGPLLAMELGIREVVIPPLPSVFCAVGCLVADVVHDAVRTVHSDAPNLDTEFAALVHQVEGWLDTQIEPAWLLSRRIERYASMRYVGQSFQIDVPLSSASDVPAAIEAFHQEHLRIYAHADRASAVEFIELRARIIGSLSTPSSLLAASSASAPGPLARRRVRFGNTWHDDVPVFAREALAAGTPIHGPAMIEQSDATITVPPEFQATAGTAGELSLVRRT